MLTFTLRHLGVFVSFQPPLRLFGVGDLLHRVWQDKLSTRPEIVASIHNLTNTTKKDLNKQLVERLDQIQPDIAILSISSFWQDLVSRATHGSDTDAMILLPFYQGGSWIKRSRIRRRKNIARMQLDRLTSTSRTWDNIARSNPTRR